MTPENPQNNQILTVNRPPKIDRIVTKLNTNLGTETSLDIFYPGDNYEYANPETDSMVWLPNQ